MGPSRMTASVHGSTLAALAALSATTAAVFLVGSWYVDVRHQQEQQRQQQQQQEQRRATPSVDPDRKQADEAHPVREIHVGNLAESDANDETRSKARVLTRGQVTIAHASVTGTCRAFAMALRDQIIALTSSSTATLIQTGSTDDWDWWDELLNDDSVVNNTSKELPPPLLVLLIPTYTDGTWPHPGTGLEAALKEMMHDWRIAKFPLKGKLQVAVFGVGSSAYADPLDGSNPTFGKPAKEAVRYFQKLGAKCVSRVAVGDCATGTHAEDTFREWSSAVGQHALATIAVTSPPQNKDGASCDCGQNNDRSTGGCCNAAGHEESKQVLLEEIEDVDVPYESDDDEESAGEEPDVVDVEDMGGSMMASNEDSKSTEPPEMVTPSQAIALKKEGYKLIGTHSAVKLCRWTKHQLRGRGGCYKHTFYGITSYQCMETTPSLACANKCVFCWRHHKNPVGKEWRWKSDDPFFIVEQAVEKHVQMIKEAKGIPGVQMDRWRSAHTVRHCALSLVGEPIMYPRIDELLGELHRRHISTFLVTNGQHPAAIHSIRPITQLYVSVDAPTRETLIEIDRPLFHDAWERLRESLTALKHKGQRTVARLTVVKGWNADEISGYAELISLGRVSLVELKGVTFCGKSDASNLNMSNSPFHHEVVALAEELKRELAKIRHQQEQIGALELVPEYDLACEHHHSCSVLLARVDQFAMDHPLTGVRKWRTWIDYDRFNELAMKNALDPSFTFAVEDYIADTPDWALFGADEEGFDPTDARHRKDSKQPRYTQFDHRGVPTRDHRDVALPNDERARLNRLMDERLGRIGTESVVTQSRDGGKVIADAKLMFRGLVVTK